VRVNPAAGTVKGICGVGVFLGLSFFLSSESAGESVCKMEMAGVGGLEGEGRDVGGVP